MAEFWDLSASDLAGAVLTYQTAKQTAKPAADARISATAEGLTTDGRTGSADPIASGRLPSWVIFAGLGLAVGFIAWGARG